MQFGLCEKDVSSGEADEPLDIDASNLRAGAPTEGVLEAPGALSFRSLFLKRI